MAIDTLFLCFCEYSVHLTYLGLWCDVVWCGMMSYGIDMSYGMLSYVMVG